MNLPRFHQDIQNYNIDLSSYLPAISEETMLAHYQHYNKYCNNLLIATESASTKYPNLKNLSLNEIVKHYFCDSVIYNNAAQVLNHQIYWNCIKPNNLSYIENLDLGKIIDNIFGSFDNFILKAKSIAQNHFGSGWLWCIQLGNDKIDLFTSSNAQNPISGYECNILFGIDLWEHAYYLDYKWDRNKYIDMVLNQLNLNYFSSQFQEFK